MLIAGIDIGGTNIRCAIGSDPLHLLAQRTTGTPRDAEPGLIVELIQAQLQACFAEASISGDELRAIGCAVPGATNATAGVVIAAANLQGWRDVPFAQMLADRFGVPAVVENDVRAAAFGELKYGAGRNRSSLVYMTISTGVSAGIIVDRRLLRGANNFAGELGFFIPDPVHLGKDWGENGCLELTAAGIGIAAQWGTMHEAAPHADSAADVFHRARAGDARAKQLIDRASDYLAQTAVALCTIVDPEILVLGGGIALNEAELRTRIESVVRETLPFPPAIAVAELGDASPLIGAFALALENSR